MFKKVMAALLCVSMLLSVSVNASVFTDVEKNDAEAYEAIGVLSELGIISGMGDGMFSPYTYLTRGQFAKIAVCIMGKSNEAVATTSAFSDVKSTDWYSGYVNCVAKEGIITGYLDGSFGVNDNLTYAQAITVIIRLLGYDASDVGYKWPMGYIEKAKVLELTKGMAFDENAYITRKEAAVLIYRALFKDIKNTKMKLVTKMDKNVYEDAVIIATKNENSALGLDQVQSDKGTFTFDKNATDMALYVGCEGTLVVNDKSEVMAFVKKDSVTAEEYTVSAVYKEGNSNNISVVTEQNGTVLLDSKTTVYIEGAAYSAEKLIDKMNSGSRLKVCSENGKVKYAFAEEYKYEGPVTFIKGSVSDMFDIENTANVKVIRKGISASMEDIQAYDVLYYSERTNTIYAYCDRVTGIYEKAYPMKETVTKVTVSGVEYTLSSMEAVNKLNESAGAFEIGDRVTLLLGSDGNVADAVKLTTADISTYGVLISSGSEVSSDSDKKGKTEYYVNILKTNGSEAKYYVADDDYEDMAGRFCAVSFKNSLAELTFPKAVVETGRIDKKEETLGKIPFAKNYSVLEYLDGDKTWAKVRKITLANIDGFKLERSDVKHVQYNRDGEIEVLYLNNATGDADIYGVLTDVPDKSGSYTILSGTKTYTVNGKYPSYSVGDCVKYADGEMSFMTKITSGTKIESCTDNVIRVNGVNYTLSDDAYIYCGKYTWELKSVSVEEALKAFGNISLYSDRSYISGGKVRVIVILSK